MAQETKITLEPVTRRNKVIFWVATVIIILWEGIMPLATMLFAPE